MVTSGKAAVQSSLLLTISHIVYTHILQLDLRQIYHFDIYRYVEKKNKPLVEYNKHRAGQQR